MNIRLVALYFLGMCHESLCPWVMFWHFVWSSFISFINKIVSSFNKNGLFLFVFVVFKISGIYNFDVFIGS